MVEGFVACSGGEHFFKCLIWEAFGERFSIFVVGDEIGVSEEVWAYDCDFELHDVHGEGSCFIGEDVLDLSELLVEGGALDGDVFVSISAVHEFVFFYEIFLEEFDHFHCDDEWDGYHGVE